MCELDLLLEGGGVRKTRWLLGGEIYSQDCLILITYVLCMLARTLSVVAHSGYKGLSYKHLQMSAVGVSIKRWAPLAAV